MASWQHLNRTLRYNSDWLLVPWPLLIVAPNSFSTGAESCQSGLILLQLFQIGLVIYHESEALWFELLIYVCPTCFHWATLPRLCFAFVCIIKLYHLKKKKKKTYIYIYIYIYIYQAVTKGPTASSELRTLTS